MSIVITEQNIKNILNKITGWEYDSNARFTPEDGNEIVCVLNRLIITKWDNSYDVDGEFTYQFLWADIRVELIHYFLHNLPVSICMYVFETLTQTVTIFRQQEQKEIKLMSGEDSEPDGETHDTHDVREGVIWDGSICKSVLIDIPLEVRHTFTNNLNAWIKKYGNSMIINSVVSGDVELLQQLLLLLLSCNELHNNLHYLANPPPDCYLNIKTNINGDITKECPNSLIANGDVVGFNILLNHLQKLVESHEAMGLDDTIKSVKMCIYGDSWRTGMLETFFEYFHTHGKTNFLACLMKYYPLTYPQKLLAFRRSCALDNVEMTKMFSQEIDSKDIETGLRAAYNKDSGSVVEFLLDTYPVLKLERVNISDLLMGCKYKCILGHMRTLRNSASEQEQINDDLIQICQIVFNSTSTICIAEILKYKDEFPQIRYLFDTELSQFSDISQTLMHIAFMPVNSWRGFRDINVVEEGTYSKAFKCASGEDTLLNLELLLFHHPIDTNILVDMLIDQFKSLETLKRAEPDYISLIDEGNQEEVTMYSDMFDIVSDIQWSVLDYDADNVHKIFYWDIAHQSYCLDLIVKHCKNKIEIVMRLLILYAIDAAKNHVEKDGNITMAILSLEDSREHLQMYRTFLTCLYYLLKIKSPTLRKLIDIVKSSASDNALLVDCLQYNFMCGHSSRIQSNMIEQHMKADDLDVFANLLDCENPSKLYIKKLFTIAKQLSRSNIMSKLLVLFPQFLREETTVYDMYTIVDNQTVGNIRFFPIVSIPLTTQSDTVYIFETTEDNICPICLTNPNTITMSCNHPHCYECICHMHYCSATEKKCPICRVPDIKVFLL